MRIHRSVLLALALTLAASPAAAQHCWPSSIALLVTDARGAVIDPAPFMRALEYAPRRGETADFEVRRALIQPLDTNRFDQPGGTPVIIWYGQGACRVDMREVVIRAQGKVMRLWVDLHIDTERNPGGSTYMLKAPRLADGTWRLDVCRLPESDNHKYAVIPARWTRVSRSGDPGTPPQGPQGCEAGAGR